MLCSCVPGAGVVGGHGAALTCCLLLCLLDWLDPAPVLFCMLGFSSCSYVAVRLSCCSDHCSTRFLPQQIQLEAEEELITNKLIKRLNALKSEKEALAMQIEQEEEYISNKLQAKLDALARDKILMENALEAEQEFIVNRLTRQLSEAKAENIALEGKLARLSRSNSAAISREDGMDAAASGLSAVGLGEVLEVEPEDPAAAAASRAAAEAAATAEAAAAMSAAVAAAAAAAEATGGRGATRGGARGVAGSPGL